MHRWIETLSEITNALAKAGSVFEHFCLQCAAHEDGTCVLTGGDAECPFLHNERLSAESSARASKTKTAHKSATRGKTASRTSRR